MKKFFLISIVMAFMSCSQENEINCNNYQTTYIKYDNQDNVILLNDVWVDNINLQTLEPINWIGIDSFTYSNCIEIKSSKKIKKIELIGFNYNYNIDYSNCYLVKIHSIHKEEYINNTDVFQLLITHEN